MSAIALSDLAVFAVYLYAVSAVPVERARTGLRAEIFTKFSSAGLNL